MLANFFYLAALIAASPLIVYRMLRHGRYRRGVGQKFLGLSAHAADQIRGRSESCVWIHAVSVGEVNLLPGVVASLRQHNPDVAIAISSTTDTGYDLAVKHFGADTVFFCPLDFTWAVKRTLRNLAPKVLILAELEIWPNLIRAATDRECPVCVINGRLSANSAAGYLKFQRLTAATFQRLAWVGCQDELSAQRFRACGTPADRLTVTGSIKFDNAPESRETMDVETRRQWAGIDPWHRVWLFGSTQAGEERMALEVYRSLQQQHPELRLILVPRHPERFESVAELIGYSGLKAHRRSRDQSLAAAQWQSDSVILVDTVGELRHWWGVCQIATVGGSFGDRGGQNMLEPAGYGCAVSFGPNTKNFAQIADRLLTAEGAVRVHDEQQLKQFVQRCLSDVPAADALGIAARRVVNQHRGATERTTIRLSQFLQHQPQQSPRRAA